MLIHDFYNFIELLPDFWRFDSNNSVTPWTLVQANATSVDGPVMRSGHKLVVNPISQNVFVLFGQGMFAYSIS